MTTLRTIGYIGNFRPEHSTENHVAQALRYHGHRVVEIQEDEVAAWRHLAGLDGLDFVLWTRTWELTGHARDAQRDALAAVTVPVVGYHLDRWWGLERQEDITGSEFFSRCDVVVTADGGHDMEWTQSGISHWWAPPAISRTEAFRTPRHRGPKQPIVFVGQRDYHREWPWRAELIRNLERRYRHRFGLYPKHRTIRGQDLTDLYASASVVVGDSCLAGSPARYWSDRIPETVGRGGFLIHPRVEGLDLTDGVHLRLVEPESWPAMSDAIDAALDDPDGRDRIAAAGQAYVREHHTYEKRMAWLIEKLERHDLLTPLGAASGHVEVTQHGLRATFELRPESSDGVVVAETWTENVYALDPADVAGKVVVDLGANIGAWSVWALLAGASHVMAVEPHDANRAVLARNMASVGDSADAGPTVHPGDDCSWSLHGVAVSSDPGRGVMEWADGEEGGARYVARADGGDVVAETLATLLEDVERVGVMKCDIEGGEYPALIVAGRDGTLDKIDRIVGEWHPDMEALIGEWVVELLRWGTLRIFGDPARGGQFEWTRYGA